MNFNNYIFILYILSFLIFEVKSVNLQQIYSIISGTLNGTATFVSLEDIDRNDTFLYFSFDFKFHNSAVENNKNVAYFLLTSELDLKMKFGFSKKNLDEIKNDEDIINIKWKRIKFLYKEKQYNDINYYFKIKRRKENMNTLLFRIPIDAGNEGSITIENILELPKFNESEKITDI